MPGFVAPLGLAVLHAVSESMATGRARGTRFFFDATRVGLSWTQAGVYLAVSLLSLANPVENPALRWVGLVLGIGGVVLRVTSILSLGRTFGSDLDLMAGARLQQRGPYGVVRHPSELGLLVLGASFWVLSSFEPVITGLFVVMVCLAHLRTRGEEAALVAALGTDYVEYRARVPRLIP